MAEALLFATAFADEDELENMAEGKLEKKKLLEAAALRNARCSLTDMIGERVRGENTVWGLIYRMTTTRR